MPYSTPQIVILLAIIPNGVAAVIAAVKWKQLPATLQPIALLTLFALFVEIFSRVLWLLKLSNLFMFPIYISVEFGLLTRMYGQVTGSRFLRRFWWVLTLCMVLAASAESFLREAQPFLIDNAVRIVESLFVILFALAYYRTSLRRLHTAYIWQDPLFWVSTGLLFFFAGNFLIYTFINFAFYYHRQLVLQLWLAHAALNSLLYCSYGYALWMSRRS